MKTNLMRAHVAAAFAILVCGTTMGTSQAQSTSHRGLVVVSGLRGQSESINARGRDVLVSGNNHRVQISGTARTVRVNGDNNHVQVHTARTIRVAGSGNRVTYDRGTSGARPHITTLSAGNVIARAR